jgi:DNA-directed RNA polymerase specialized sigma24 family protein
VATIGQVPNGARQPDFLPGFIGVYEAHVDSMYRFLVLRTRHSSAAQEATAEVFAIAWRRFNEVEELHSSGQRLWLFRVAFLVELNGNRAKRHYRNVVTRLSHSTGLTTPDVSPDSASASTHDADINDQLLRTMAALSNEQRDVLELTAWEHLNGKDLGMVLGCTHQAARLKLMRVRRVFANQFEQINGFSVVGESGRPIDPIDWLRRNEPVADTEMSAEEADRVLGEAIRRGQSGPAGLVSPFSGV